MGRADRPSASGSSIGSCSRIPSIGEPSAIRSGAGRLQSRPFSVAMYHAVPPLARSGEQIRFSTAQSESPRWIQPPGDAKVLSVGRASGSGALQCFPSRLRDSATNESGVSSSRADSCHIQ